MTHEYIFLEVVYSHHLHQQLQTIRGVGGKKD